VEKKSGSWLLQAVDSKKMVKVDFVCSMNHRKAARAEPNRYAEYFRNPFGYMRAETYLDGYCRYSGNIHLVILKEITFCSYNRYLF